MPKFKNGNVDPSQKLITNFFSIQKEPVEIECKNVITKAENDKLTKLYKRKNKKLEKIGNSKINIENIECEVLNNTAKQVHSTTAIATQKETVTTDIYSIKYSISCKSTSDLLNIEIDESPSKKQRRKTAVLDRLTETKPNLQIKDVGKKIPYTFQTSQPTCINNNSSGLLPSEEMSLLTNIGDLLEIELLDEDNNFYKITNHVHLVDDIIDNTINSNLSMLLLNNEKKLLEDYQELSVYEKYFSCKLFTHQLKWYNSYKFAKNINLPISAAMVKQIIAHLQEKLIVKSDYSSETPAYLLNLLNAGDVKKIYSALRLKKKEKRKPLLINAILDYVNNQSTLHPSIGLDKKVWQMIADQLGDVVHISALFYKAFYKVHLLYTYTNPEFDIPSGLYRRMNEMTYGRVVHPDVTFQDQTVFMNNLEYDDFYKAFVYKAEVMQTLEKRGTLNTAAMFELGKSIVKEFTAILKIGNTQNKPKYLQRFTSGYQYASALWILSKHLGGKYPSEIREWLELLLEQTQFCQKKRGLWYSHLSIVYNTHLKDYTKAAEILLRGLRDSEVSSVDAADIIYRARNHCSKKKVGTTDLRNELLAWNECTSCTDMFPSITIKALTNSSAEGVRRGNYKYMDANGDISYLNVEQIAIMHYMDEKGFTNGIHCEGALMQAIFYILFWDIIYTDEISYSFICKMQYLPLDFNSEEFYYNRKAKIDRRLVDIKFDWSTEEFKCYIIQSWDCVSKYKALFILDHITDSERLYKIVSCIGRNVISSICQRLANNFRDHRAGMPDLFVYNKNSYKFVEVKGPGDKLSTKQKLWISYLLSIGANVEVCYVSTKFMNASALIPSNS